MIDINRKELDYYTSGNHKANVLRAQRLGRVVTQQRKQDRRMEYEKCPSVCAQCVTPLTYLNRRNKFCSTSCSATFNNLRRRLQGNTRSDESRAKTRASALKHFGSLTPTEKMLRFQNYKARNGRTKNPDVEFVCSICKVRIMVPYIRRKLSTCGSEDCKVQASIGQRTYQNGSRKPVWFFNPNENKDVLLDSSWEVIVATKLIDLGIKWIRPKFIKWVDNMGTTRRYFPDFYLPDYDLYLDPKNPYCMMKDLDKMAKVSELVNIVYGDIKLVISHITGLVKQS